MNIYVFTFPGHWLGGAAVIVAPNGQRARSEFNALIAEHKEAYSGRTLGPFTAEEAPAERIELGHLTEVVYFDSGTY